MANGIPCQWCGYMEASHRTTNILWDRGGTCPCDSYEPLAPIFMQEIELAAGHGRPWKDVLPSLGSNYRFTRRALRS